MRRDGPAIQAETRLGLADHALHHLADVIDIQAGAVEGAVGDLGGQHLADRAHAALQGRIVSLDHQRRRAHADDRAVTARVKRQRGPVQAILGRRRAGGEHARADPLHHRFAGRVVAGDDDHPPAAPAANPVFGYGHGMRRRGAGGIDVCVRPTRADVLGKLRVAHGQHAENELAIKGVIQFGQPTLNLLDAAIQLIAHGIGGGHLAQPGECFKLPVQRLEILVAGHLLAHAVEAGPGRAENDPRFVAQRLGQGPAVGQISALAGAAIAHHQRDARVAQRVDPGGDGELCGDVQRVHPLGGDAKLLGQIEISAPPGQFDRVGGVVDDLKGRPGFALDQAGDPPRGHLPALITGHRVDELIAAQDALDVIGGKDVAILTGQAKRRAADHHRAGERQAATGRRLGSWVIR